MKKRIQLFALSVLLSAGICVASGPLTQQFTQQHLAFTENRGQVCGHDGLPQNEIKFYTGNRDMQIFLLADGLAYQFKKVHYPQWYSAMLLSNTNTDRAQLKRMEKEI